jgi:hypothetical protein
VSDQKLHDLVDSLERYLAARPEKATREMRWFIESARAYFRGEFDSIDAALGLPTELEPTNKRRYIWR